jgi:acyl-CoA dehydrogenase
MDFNIPQDIQAYLKELDQFIEREIKPMQEANDNMRFIGKNCSPP